MPPDDRAGLDEPYVVAVPLFKPGTFLDPLVAALAEQDPSPAAFIFLDSSPRGHQATRPDFATLAGLVVLKPIAEFDHGQTRNIALDEAAAHADICIFLSQDAVPATPQSLPLLATEIRGNVWAASGRQLPRPGADPIEVAQRQRRYPAESAERPLSNAFAAYRISRFRDIGGFRHPCIWGEDFLATADISANGGRVVYAQRATVRHSHPFSPPSDIRRYFDAGAARQHSRKLPSTESLASAEGIGALRADITGFLPRRPDLALKTLGRFIVRTVGYLAGRIHPLLPANVVLGLTSNRAYWLAQRDSSVNDD